MRTLIVLFACFMSIVAPARAADGDVAAAQTVIRSQAEAIGRDDATAAYSYASPQIQSMYREPDLFMGMVQTGYPPIYRHRSFVFGDSHSLDGKVAQEVHIIDSEGVAWEAMYTLEQQSDGSMKITSCVLSKALGV